MPTVSRVTASPDRRGRYRRAVSDITVAPQDGGFAVTVRQGRATTRHTVVVPAELPAAVGWDGLPHADLVRASFEFLLEREPASSILTRFRLDVIADYFPDYRREIRRRAPRGGD